MGSVHKVKSELIPRRARRDDDFTPSEQARVNRECARSQEDEGDRDRHRKEAGDPGGEEIETLPVQGGEVDRDQGSSARDGPTPDGIAQLESNAGGY